MIVDKVLKYATCVSDANCFVYPDKIVVDIHGRTSVSITLTNSFGCSYTMDIQLPCQGDYLVIYIADHAKIQYA